MGIVEELTAGPEFNHFRQPGWQDAGAIIVLAGQHCVEDAPRIAEQINACRWSLTIVCSDEEALFPVQMLARDPRHAIFGEYHARPEFDRVLPIGCPPGTAEWLRQSAAYERDRSVMFMGQNTHARRKELIDVMKGMALSQKYGDVDWFASTGFREGLTQDQYLWNLLRTRIAPCPSGPHSLDSFRLYEALAAGALPVIEMYTPHGDERDFWRSLFGQGCPIDVVESWRTLPQIVDEYSRPDVWRGQRDQVQAWWASWRAQLQTDFNVVVQTLRTASE